MLDLSSLLRGDYKVDKPTRLFALSPLTSIKRGITVRDLEFLLQIPDDVWTSEEDLLALEVGLDLGWLREMAHHGLLISDEKESSLITFRRRAEILMDREWHPLAALYHFMTRGHEECYLGNLIVDDRAAEAEAVERARQFVEEHGLPPEPFRSVSSASRIELPFVEKDGPLYEVLKRRRTTRVFDTSQCVTLADFSTLLYYTFGCHGCTYLSPELMVIRRTSPSGGSRHPIGAYPLVLRVQDLAPGLYHYDMYNHALELIREYELEEAQALAVEFSGGQEYMRASNALIIMAARYYVNYWKYRRRSRTYGVILMDTAHLSQTFYLVGTELELCTFFSAAINAPRIDEELSLDGYEEGALAICGCGIKPDRTQDRGPRFQPFIPGRDPGGL